MPFDWKNPIGYSIATVLQTIIISYPFRFLVGLVLLAFGAFLFAITLIKDAVDDIKDFNNNLKALKSEPDVFKMLSESVHVHSVGKELSEVLFNRRILNALDLRN